MIKQNQAYWDGIAKLKIPSPLAWPRSFRSVAELLDLPYEVFSQIRHSTFRGRQLNFNEAVEAWRWLCYMNRSEHMRELTGRKRIERKRSRGVVVFP